MMLLTGSLTDKPSMTKPQRDPSPADVLVVMVPGMGMQAADFDEQGFTDALRARGWPVATAAVDPGPDAYLDGSAEARLLDGIAAARRASGARRVWLAGISLGCQGILRCVWRQPDLAEGLILLTPYVASTGLIAEVTRTGGLRRWAASAGHRPQAERALLRWLATARLTGRPRVIVGRALSDRFAATSNLLAELLPPAQVVTVVGLHDWTSWRTLWGKVLEQNPFSLQPAEVS